MLGNCRPNYNKRPINSSLSTPSSLTCMSRSAQIPSRTSDNKNMALPDEIANFFHSLPRFNFHFQLINSRQFDYFSGDYVQSLIMWAASSLIICTIVLIFISISWSISSSNKANQSKRSNVKLSKAAVHCSTFSIVLSCIAVCGCLLTNEVTNRSLANAHAILGSQRQRFEITLLKIRGINESLRNEANVNLKQLKTGLFGFRAMQQKYLGVETWVLRVTEVENEMLNLTSHLDTILFFVNDFINFFDVVNSGYRYEFERHILFSCLFTITFIVMLFGLMAAITRSRRCLVLFGGCAILMFIVNWCVVGAFLAMNILISDFCKHSMPFNFFGINQIYRENHINNLLIENSNETTKNDFDSISDARKLLETSVEQIPAIISGVSCLLGQNAGEASLSVVQILAACQRVQQNFYGILKNLGSINDLLNNDSYRFHLHLLKKNVCNVAVLSTAATLFLLIVFIFLLFIILCLLKRAYFCLLDDHQLKISNRGTANGHHRSTDNVGAEHLAACSSLYERGEPFFGNVNCDADSIPAEFYGTHVSNPRTRQQNGRIEGNPEHSVCNQRQIFRPSPPPAYEHVPLLHTQRS